MSKNDDYFFNINKSGLEFAKPNILQMFGSYIITDPKGKLCRDTAGFLHENGYNVKVLNLIQFEKSSRYNPLYNYRSKR